LWQAGYVGKHVHVNLPALAAIPNQNISGPEDYRAEINPNDLTSLGATAYNKLRPKIAVAGLGQAIAEARDVPATLKTTAKGFSELFLAKGGSVKGTLMQPKKVADHFINHEFGWVPFVNDVTQMYDLIAHYEDHLTKAEKLNDKWLHRRFAEEEVLSDVQIYDQTRQSTSPTFTAYLNPLPGGLGQLKSVTLKVRRQKMTRIWYEGLFKYYRIELDRRIPMQENLRAGRGFLTLAGANINPALIYKVTPWTWCVDWFTNVGANVQMAQDILDNSVASKYMYLMRETFDRYEYTSTHTFNTGMQIVGTSYQEVRVKRRVGADSPFGFSLTGDLNSVQIAILLALGISKG